MATRFAVPFSYLPEEFADSEPIFERIKAIVAIGDYTLGAPVAQFEEGFARLVGARHAIGVNSGTDALRLSLRALGVSPGDEVITAANTFIATVGAIADLSAKTVFVDCTDDLCMDVSQVEAAITPHTKAIVPVHLSGAMVDMTALLAIAERHRILVVEDACQAIKSSLDGRPAGSWGNAAAFSLHPLKFLNIWGDGGVISTNDDKVAQDLRLLRNHGLVGRDVVVSLGVNSRLDTIQAIVGLRGLERADAVAESRRKNAAFYDAAFADVRQIELPTRNARLQHSHVTYQIFAERRDELVRHCIDRGIECKVHYPIALYCQEGLRHLGYKPGDFPVTDRQAQTTMTLPVHQYLTEGQLSLAVAAIKEFYRV